MVLQLQVKTNSRPNDRKSHDVQGQGKGGVGRCVDSYCGRDKGHVEHNGRWSYSNKGRACQTTESLVMYRDCMSTMSMEGGRLFR